LAIPIASDHINPSLPSPRFEVFEVVESFSTRGVPITVVLSFIHAGLIDIDSSEVLWDSLGTRVLS
jgi:hypothetical protein